MRGYVCLILGLGVFLKVGLGCRSRPIASGVDASQTEPPLAGWQIVPELEARCAPPPGWSPRPLEQTGDYAQVVWISPSGDTAYGVARFRLPLPVGPNLALHLGFLPRMKQSEGRAALISKEHDPSLPGLRFVAEGGRYRVRTNLITDGLRGWAVYAGTLLERPVASDELKSAELARERTRVGPGE